MVQRGWFYHHRVTKPSLCSNRYDKDRLHMFSIKPFKYNFPQRLKWWITLGTEVTTWTRSAPSQGRSLGWWCEGQLLGSLKEKLWSILYTVYTCHVFYDFVWCILYAFYGIDIWYILWCCMSCIGVFFSNDIQHPLKSYGMNDIILDICIHDYTWWYTKMQG